MLLIIVLYALFGTSMLIGKILLQYHTTPIFLAASRMILAGLALISFQSTRKKTSIIPNKSHFWEYTQIIILGFYINYILRFWALQWLDASKTAFLYNLSPFMACFYSYLFFNKKLNRSQWIGLIIGCIGLIPVLITTSPIEQLFGELSIISLPELAVIISVAAHTYSWIVMQKLVKDQNVSPIQVNGITMLIGGLLSLGTAWYVEGFFPVVQIKGFAAWLCLVVIISNIICHNLYGYLLRDYSATFLAFSGFLSPLFTAFYGWLLLGETVSWHFYLSTAIVMLGLYLFHKEELRELHNPKH